MTHRLSTLIYSSIIILSIPSLGRAFYVEARAGADSGPQVVTKYNTTQVKFRIGCFPSTQGRECADILRSASSTDLTFDSIVAAARAAFKTWSDISCSTLDFVEDSPVKDTTSLRDEYPKNDNVILIMFSATEEWDSVKTGSAFSLGTTSFVHNNDDGRMGTSTIVLNSRNYFWSTSDTPGAGQLDLQAILTALIGRAIGITSAMPGNATHPIYYQASTAARTLGQDDLDAFRYLYPQTSGSCPAIVPPQQICYKPPLNSSDPKCPPTISISGDAGVGAIGPGDPPTPTFPTPTPKASSDDGCSCSAAGAGPSIPHVWTAIFGAVAVLLVIRRKRNT